MKINIARIKGWGPDQNGLNKVIYLTEAQVDTLGQMRNDSDKRYCFVKVGRMMFSPMDVMYIEEVDKEPYELPKYCINRIEHEKALELGEGRKELHG